MICRYHEGQHDFYPARHVYPYIFMFLSHLDLLMFGVIFKK